MLISTKKQLIKNLDRVEGYLSSGSNELFDTMAKYIARGRVFVSYKVGGTIHFAPSRFVGYQNNSLVKHQKNKEKNHEKDSRNRSRTVHGIFRLRSLRICRR